MKLLYLLAIISVPGLAQDARTVCETLSGASNVQRVLVRGHLSGSAHHGFSLSQGFTPDPCPGNRRNWFTWPSILPLTFHAIGEATLAPDEVRANEALWNVLVKMERDGVTRKKPMVRVRGILLSKEWAMIFRRGDGEYFGTGLGSSGAFRSMLVVQSIDFE